ncbi:hypothetical protein [Aeromonas veronii]|uniref:hypothetical protein n=1 Tax=Aeromonas veronii TaxID=654 RepID=UPI001F239CC9|nr:hypothetical protein [Aeromonas veronii]
MQSQTHTFIVNGSAQPCLRAGSGEPLLLIHGALANHTLWFEHIRDQIWDTHLFEQGVA